MGIRESHVAAQLQRDSPKANVWCGLMHNKIIGPFFFTEKCITVYLDLLQLFVASQLEEFQPWIMFQQDGAPPHWGSLVCDFLDETFPDRWIGRHGSGLHALQILLLLIFSIGTISRTESLPHQLLKSKN
ncbi:hypothetical protein AVEN_118-1 [Araneus ventricosus]|uniref:Tc1-like transposase DDE domain-containing protein n=1 Tax=Araneus ventricosus TaxID=182803 RepID=A0A4Y2D342_ARAVE|nr:hypothetical protein AVEN_118-1 [Araneus ventricosus]